MVMITLTVLSLVGVALVSTTLWGYRMKMFDNRSKEALYVSEAGLDEAYAYLGKEVENAVIYSRDVYVAGQLHNNKDEWSLKTDTELQDQLDQEFKIGFKKYFNDSGNMATITNNMMDKVQFRNGATLGANAVRIENMTVTTLQKFNQNAGSQSDMDTMILQVVSNVRGNYDLTHHDSPTGSIAQTTATDTITCNLVVTVPPYETPFQKHLGQYMIRHNVLWDYALNTDGDFKAINADVTVNGNVYARGVGVDDSGSPLADDQMGGIIAGGVNPLGGNDSGEIMISGSAVTQRFLETRDSTSASPARIQVDQDALANSIVTQGVGNVGSRIAISGHAYVEDDTEMDAQKSVVSIAGDYYGFSRGEESTASHDKSSSIVFNQEDFGASGSQFTIGGNTYIAGLVYINQGKKYHVTAQPLHGTVSVSEDDGKYIYKPLTPSDGTTDSFTVSQTLVDDSVVPVTVSVLKGAVSKGLVAEAYVTGDSMSVIGNYLGYSQTLPNAPEPYKSLDSTFFKEYIPMTLVYKKNELDSDGVTFKNMFYDDKSKYARYAQQQDAADGTDMFNLGNNRISVGTPVFTLGNLISSNHISAPMGSIGDALTSLDNFQQKFHLYSDYLGDVNLSSGSAPDALASGWLKSTSWSTVDYTENNSGKTDHFYGNSSATTSVIIQGKNASTDVSSLIATLSGSFKMIDASSANEQRGIIVSQGPVYIVGDLSYTGLIISGKGITSLNGTQTFTTDIPFIHDRFFRELQINKTKYLAGVCSLFQQREDETALTQDFSIAEIYQTGATPEYVGSMNGIIRITEWQKIRHIQ